MNSSYPSASSLCATSGPPSSTIPPPADSGPRLAHGVDGRAHEARHRHARDRLRVLEGEEEAGLRARVCLHVDQVLAVEEDLALGDLVTRVAHERVGEG